MMENKSRIIVDIDADETSITFCSGLFRFCITFKYMPFIGTRWIHFDSVKAIKSTKYQYGELEFKCRNFDVYREDDKIEVLSTFLKSFDGCYLDIDENDEVRIAIPFAQPRT